MFRFFVCKLCRICVKIIIRVSKQIIEGECMNYLDILQDVEIVAIFTQIEILKQNNAKHYGMIHTLSTIEFAKQLAECFDLEEHETELLLVACSLHNIGHLHGKSLHAQTGAEMSKPYLKKKGFNQKDIITICSAISSHVGRKSDNFYNPVSACLILADKMDFGSTRIKPYFAELSAEEKLCKNITRVEVKRKGNVVQLTLGGKSVDWNMFVQSSIYSKLYNCFEVVCKKYGYKFVVKVSKVA
jgi:HD superfamily phosphohydrolase YqeK